MPRECDSHRCRASQEWLHCWRFLEYPSNRGNTGLLSSTDGWLEAAPNSADARLEAVVWVEYSAADGS